MKCLYTFWAPGPERQWATINKEPSWAACSSRVRPAEGANAGSERGGRQPSGQLLNPVGSDTSWAVTECWGRSPSCPLVFGSTVRDLQRSENSPEEWSWEDEERRKEALDRSCPTDKRVRGFKIWQGSWKQNGVSFDHSQTLYWRNPTSKASPSCCRGWEGRKCSSMLPLCQIRVEEASISDFEEGGRGIQGHEPSVSLALSPGPTCVQRELNPREDPREDIRFLIKNKTCNLKWLPGGGSPNICPHAYILGFLVFMSWKLLA